MYENRVDVLFREYNMNALIYFYHLGVEFHDREK